MSSCDSFIHFSKLISKIEVGKSALRETEDIKKSFQISSLDDLEMKVEEDLSFMKYGKFYLPRSSDLISPMH